MIGFITDYHLGKLNPLIFHFDNVLLHIISVVLLFYYLFTVTKSKLSSLLGALLFALHPMVTHAVAWIPGRNDELLFIFTVLSLIYLYNYHLVPAKSALIIHCFCYLLALFTKESTIVLPLLYYCPASCSIINCLKTQWFLSVTGH